MNEIVFGTLMLVGAALMLLAAVGVLRLPDLYTRMHSTTKAASLGVALLLVGAAVHFQDYGVAARALATVTFIFMTSPIAAHLLGRAAYFVGTPLWPGSVRDDLRGHYNRRTHELESVITRPSRRTLLRLPRVRRKPLGGDGRAPRP